LVICVRGFLRKYHIYSVGGGPAPHGKFNNKEMAMPWVFGNMKLDSKYVLVGSCAELVLE
jgi:hypothetical protein